MMNNEIGDRAKSQCCKWALPQIAWWMSRFVKKTQFVGLHLPRVLGPQLELLLRERSLPMSLVPTRPGGVGEVVAAERVLTEWGPLMEGIP